MPKEPKLYHPLTWEQPKNFLNLNYTKWLNLPIKKLPFARKLFNVDSTENKAGQLQFYMDLVIQTGTTTTNMRFFLTHLGDGSTIPSCLLCLEPQTWLKHDSYHMLSTNPDQRK